MSRLFGSVRQNDYVVRDIHAAMQHWITTAGVVTNFIDATMVMSARRKLLREGSFLTRKNRSVPRHAPEEN